MNKQKLKEVLSRYEDYKNELNYILGNKFKELYLIEDNAIIIIDSYPISLSRVEICEIDNISKLQKELLIDFRDENYNYLFDVLKEVEKLKEKITYCINRNFSIYYGGNYLTIVITDDNFEIKYFNFNLNINNILEDYLTSAQIDYLNNIFE
jgi:hypothetical protein